jgi:hypothetical protein
VERRNVQESGHHVFRNQGTCVGELRKNGQDDDKRCSGTEMEKKKKKGEIKGKGLSVDKGKRTVVL